MLPLLLCLTLGQVEPAAEKVDPQLAQAFRLLKPHLTWHAPFAPPVEREDIRRAKQDREKAHEDAHPWQESLGSHALQRGDVPQALLDMVKKEAEAHPDRPRVPDVKLFPWRLKDPAHADVAAALKLLDAVKDNDTARRLAAELRRNNTVLTLDLGGAYPAGKAVRFVLDARNADRVTLSLYRITTAEDLLRVLDRIGTDFTFRAHDTERARERMKMARDERKSSREEELVPLLPDVLKGKPLATWEQPLEKLRRIPLDDLRHWYALHTFREGNDRYDDECYRHQRRLDREYLPEENAYSTWQAGLIVEIPNKHLAQPGAYLLRVEANGQSALAPLLIDPPAMTLRRCPDGVLALVGTEGGAKPLAGAKVQARKNVVSATTDREGVAFLRVFGRGDRAIVAEHEGRFAVGGFGAVFAGVYIHPDDDHRRAWERGDRKDRAARVNEGHLFADGHLVALWTDRPAYRPGESLRAKLIVRKRSAAAPDDSFRAEDYAAPRLDLLPEGTEVKWELLDPEHGVVAEGAWKLNDHGTAAGDVQLNANCPHGACLFRVTIKERRYVLPDVFLIGDLALPAIEIDLGGLPAKWVPGATLDLAVAARHVTGLPVTRGSLTLTLHGESLRWNLTPDAIALDKQGRARVKVPLPKHLPAERLTLRAALTEGSVTIQRNIVLSVEERASPLLGKLPKFVSAAEPFVLATKADEVEVEQGKRDDELSYRVTRYRPTQGQVRITFARPGWHTLRAGDEEHDIFAYGGKEPPDATTTRSRQNRDGDTAGPWIDLAHYENESGESWNDAAPLPCLHAMIGSHEGQVGGTVPVLVYVPASSARLLLTIEGHSVLDYVPVRVASATTHYHVLQVPLRERYAPHFYLQGCVLGLTGAEDVLERQQMARKALEKLRRDIDEDEGDDPAWCKIVVRGTPRPGTLNVTLTPDRTDYEPGERVTVEVLTTDAAGKPVAAEVALSAVDERIYTLAGDRLPLLVATLTGARGPEKLSQKTWRHSPGARPGNERRRERLQKQAQEAAKAQLQAEGRSDSERLLTRPPLRPLDELGQLPVAVVPMTPLRDPSRTTAHAVTTLRTDATGRARVEFTAPGNLTRYRVGAFALTKTGLVGMGRATFRTGKRLEVEALLPPAVPLGTTFEVPVIIRNASARERRVEVQAVVTGLEWPGGPERARTVTVPARGTATVRLTVRARTEGPASVRVTAGDAAEDDAETRVTRIVKPPPEEKNETPPAPGM